MKYKFIKKFNIGNRSVRSQEELNSIYINDIDVFSLKELGAISDKETEKKPNKKKPVKKTKKKEVA